MEATPARLNKVLGGPRQFVVPPYQRRYQWTPAQITELVEDAMQVAASDRPRCRHYTGALVVHPDPIPGREDVERCYVVDGQQRLTTISMMLAAIGRRAAQGGLRGTAPGPEALRATFIENAHAPDHLRWKLRLQQPDDEAWARIIDGVARVSGDARICEAWGEIQAAVRRHDPADLFRGLNLLEFIFIELSPDDDPQQVFESMNTKGRELASIEKVKNYIFTGMPIDVQQRVSDSSWRELERATRASADAKNAASFLRDFLRWKTGRNVGERQSYREFRRWRCPHGEIEASSEREVLCAGMRDAAVSYARVVRGLADTPPAIEVELRQLRSLGTTVHATACLRLLAEDAAERAAGEDPSVVTRRTAAVLNVLARWLTRAFYVGGSKSGFNTQVIDMTRRLPVSGPDGKAAVWAAAVSALRSSKVGVPGDAEIRAATLARTAYGGQATGLTKAVLYGIAGGVPGSGFSDGLAPELFMTVEHVLPVKLNSDWRAALGSDAEAVHEKWRHRIANLVLLNIDENGAAGASAFEQKRRVYAQADVPFTREIAAQTEWSEATLLARSSEISAAILKTWPWSPDGCRSV